MHGVSRLLWSGNSPDINTIEPCWPYLKKTTTACGAPQTGALMEKAWVKAWRDLPQDKIRAWIERIPVHIEEFIRLEGGNEYPEVRKAFKRCQKGSRIKGVLSKHTYLTPQDVSRVDDWESDTKAE
jgi:hypothetical protein